MTAFADLVGDLSWGLKAAWIVWGTWIAIQVVWRRRIRIDVSTLEALSPRRIGDRLTLGIADGPEGIRVPARPVSRLPPAPPSIAEPSFPQPATVSAIDADAVSAIDDSVEALPVESATPKRPKRRRQAARSETATAMQA